MRLVIWGVALVTVGLLAVAGCGNIEWFPDPIDRTPDAFGFTSVNCIATSTVAVSNEVTISGLGTEVDVIVSGGEYSIDGGTYTSQTGKVTNGKKITVRHTSASINATNQITTTVLTVGTFSASFTSNVGPYLSVTPFACP